MNHYRHITLILLTICGLAAALSAQVLDYANRVTLVLDDDTNVTLYGAANSLSSNFSGNYYWLPVGLTLAKKNDGTPQFLFSKFTTDERVEEGGVSGALMHFLMQWGLTAQQERELQAKLSAKLKDLAKTDPRFKDVTSPRIMGAVPVRAAGDNSFEVISAVLRNAKSTPTLVTSGRASLIPGGKVAIGALLEEKAAQLLAASFEKGRSITDVSVAMRFEYDVLMPAVQGRITVNWERIDSVYQAYHRQANHYDGGDKGQSDDTVSDTEADSLFTTMRETKAVDVQLDNLQPDSEIAKDMVNAFMEYFLRSVSEKEFRRPGDDEDPDDKRNDQRNYRYTYKNYKVDRRRWAQKLQRRTETYNLNVRLPITQEFDLVENLAAWYDGVRDNEKCINTVNLSDPFFQHRDIYLILDLDAETMFGKELNYVTVDIRKRRSEDGAHDFSRQITFDKRRFEADGNRAVVTYSKAEDENPDLFEYKVQWSLRGGNVFPKDTSWTRGRWEGITLAPPVAPTPIRFEADLEDLSDLDIRNVSLQMRYYKFGREVEKNFNLNVSQNIGYLEDQIFMDRNTQGYAYRFVFFHKQHGPMATDWDARINTGYQYAVIPEELRRPERDVIDKMVELGKEVAAATEGQEVKTGKVLDKFRDLIITN